jgi:phage internal scaffolding protein
MTDVIFNSAYSSRKRVSLDTGKESMTQQNFKKECDINNIMRKYQKTGLVDHVAKYQGDYSDVSNVPTYHEALGIIQSAHTAFDSLPSNIRKKFENDPGKFLAFVDDPANVDEMREMGLLNPVQVEQAPAAAPPVVDPPAPEPEA